MVRRSVLFLVLVGVCSAVVAAAVQWVRQAPGAKPARLVLLIGADSTTTRSLVAGAIEAAADLDAELHVQPISRAERDAPDGLRVAIDDARHDGLIVGPIAGYSEQELEEIAGLNPAVRVVTCQPHVLPARRKMHIGGGEYALGRRGAAAVRQLTATPAVAVTYDGRHPDIRFRLQGLEDGLAASPGEKPPGPAIEIRRAPVPAGNVTETLRALLAAEDDLRCLICFDNAHTLAAAQLQGDAIASERVVLVGFHPTDETFALLAAGRVDAVVAERPFDLGRQAVRRTAALCEATPFHQPATGQGNFYVPPQIVTRQEVQRFLEPRPAEG